MIELKTFVLILWLPKKVIVINQIINSNITDLHELVAIIYYMVEVMEKPLGFGLIIVQNRTFTSYIEMKKEFS